jgi:hypothetical protein
VSKTVILADFQRLILLERDPPKSKTIQEGAATTVAAALDPSLDDFSGAYLNDCKVAQATEFAFDEKNAETLWDLSEELVEQRFVL